jgi:poly-gamma-glutamate synthesis protein (capsule biosynthesis protein)
VGFNLFSAANNHAIDFGEAGIEETMRHLEAARAHGLLAWHGLGTTREQTLVPARLEVKGARVAFSALGIGGRDFSGAPVQRAGMLSYHTDFDDAVYRLAAADTHLRILSVHYGNELQVRPSGSDERKLREALVKGVDIVVGHHAHVAAGVAVAGGGIAFYGMGNLLHPGMQDMARMNACRDYGLLARVHLSPDDGGRLRPRAIEAVPLTGMHEAARPMDAAEGSVRVEVLNHLAAGLDDPVGGATGVRFTPRADGTGLYCFPGSKDLAGRIGALCRDWQAPEAAASPAARRAAHACGASVAAARGTGARRLARSSEAGAEGPRPPRQARKKRRKSQSWFWF